MYVRIKISKLPRSWMTEAIYYLMSHTHTGDDLLPQIVRSKI